MIFPSSIFPAISGQANGSYPSGYDTVKNKLYLLSQASGLFTGNLADFKQDRDYIGDPLGVKLQGFNGDGINKYYPSPSGYAAGNNKDGTLYGPTGIFITYPPNESSPEWSSYNGSKGSGIFNFKDLLSNFSNAKASRDITDTSGINDFTIFNDYIHYLPASEDKAIKVPFVSDLIPTNQTWDRYKKLKDD